MGTKSSKPPFFLQLLCLETSNLQQRFKNNQKSCQSSLHPEVIYLVISLLIQVALPGYGQNIHRNTIFYKPSLAELQQVIAPRQSEFKPITHTPVTINNYNPILGNNAIEQQNRNILQRQGMLPGQNTKQQEWQRIKQELREDEIIEKQAQLLSMVKPFHNSFYQFMQMNPDSFSISKAVYLSESAWYDNPPAYEQFLNVVNEKVDLAKQILKSEKLNANNNTAVHYAIQKLFRRTIHLSIPKLRSC